MWFGHLGIQDLQIRKFRSYRLCSYLPLEINLLVEKKVMLPAALPDIESEILCCKDILLPK